VSARGVFITGTDTAVGKTLVGCALVRGLVALGLKVAVMKPVAAGAEPTPQGLRNADALVLMAASNVAATYEEVNPYCLNLAVSPHIAANEDGTSIDIDMIAEDLDRLARRSDFVVVEGAGGWLAPLSDTQTMADLARTLGLPVLLVVGLKLGCLNHAHLTRASIDAHGVAFAGWIASCLDGQMVRPAENLATLARTLREPALAIVPFTARFESALSLKQAALRLARTVSA
jgi:dethiobiotin synthetase